MSIKLLVPILAVLLMLVASACFASFRWGAYVDIGDMASFESMVGESADIQAVFTGWGSGSGDFPDWNKSTVADKGKTLLIFWEPTVNYDSIMSGNWDSYLRSFVAKAKDYGGHVILVPFSEMNGNWSVWSGTTSGNTPQKAVNGWRYVHKFFNGVSNVKFGWAPNNVSVPDTQANAIGAYYPGDEYVDYVGIDGFNFGNPWQSWQNVFFNSLNVVRQYNKPVYIFSTGSCPGAAKAQWMNEMGEGLRQYNIAGWVWFNANKECDWRVNSDAAALVAFKSLVSDSGEHSNPVPIPSPVSVPMSDNDSNSVSDPVPVSELEPVPVPAPKPNTNHYRAHSSRSSHPHYLYYSYR